MFCTELQGHCTDLSQSESSKVFMYMIKSAMINILLILDAFVSPETGKI